MNNLIALSEPPLEFALKQTMHHPRDGLTLFGPFESKGVDRPKQLTYGVFGTPVGVKLFKDFSAALSRPILTEPNLNEVLWPHYSGFEELFHATWPSAGTPTRAPRSSAWSTPTTSSSRTTCVRPSRISPTRILASYRPSRATASSRAAPTTRPPSTPTRPSICQSCRRAMSATRFPSSERWACSAAAP